MDGWLNLFNFTKKVYIIRDFPSTDYNEINNGNGEFGVVEVEVYEVILE